MKPSPLVPAAQEAAVPGRPSLCSTTTPAPRSHTKGNDCLGDPILWEEATQVAFLHYPSLVLPHVSIPELNLEKQLSLQEEKVPIKSPAYSSPDFLGCSSWFWGSAASRVPGGSGLLSGLQGELLWEPDSSRVTPSLPPGRAQGLR